MYAIERIVALSKLLQDRAAITLRFNPPDCADKRWSLLVSGACADLSGETVGDTPDEAIDAYLNHIDGCVRIAMDRVGEIVHGMNAHLEGLMAERMSEQEKKRG